MAADINAIRQQFAKYLEEKYQHFKANAHLVGYTHVMQLSEAIHAYHTVVIAEKQQFFDEMQAAIGGKTIEEQASMVSNHWVQTAQKFIKEQKLHDALQSEDVDQIASAIADLVGADKANVKVVSFGDLMVEDGHGTEHKH